MAASAATVSRRIPPTLSMVFMKVPRAIGLGGYSNRGLLLVAGCLGVSSWTANAGAAARVEEDDDGDRDADRAAGGRAGRAGKAVRAAVQQGNRNAKCRMQNAKWRTGSRFPFCILHFAFCIGFG